MVFEIDDLIFKTGLGPADKEDGIPSYNLSSQHINLESIHNCLKEVIPLMDLVVVSTDYLKKAFEKVFGANNVMTIKNVVPRYLWNYPRKGDITEDLKKPKVIYSGSPTHYINPVPPRAPSPQEPQGFPGIAGKRGDWNTALCDCPGVRAASGSRWASRGLPGPQSWLSPSVPESLLPRAPCPVTGSVWKIPWTEEPGGLQSMGSLRVRHN